MKVKRSGKLITLSDSDFLSAGGEGSVYLKNTDIYKIYNNQPKYSISDKIKELSVLDKPNILRPVDLVLDETNSQIGFTMRYVDNTTSLPLLFTTSFRDRNSITPDNITKLVENIASTIQFIHDKKILIVDANEFNYLVSKNDYETPFFIDVDSYQTPNFPATAIMPSIQDYTSVSFSELTDWYSFAIVSFQLFVGIHPYKGSHPNFKKDDIASRCKSHVSVFNKEVKFPSVTRSFDLIPTNYRDWFHDVLEKGERKLPPTIAGKIIAKAQQTIVTNKLSITEVLEFSEKIKNVKFYPMYNIIVGETIYKVGNNTYKLHSKHSEIILFNGEILELFIRNGKLHYVRNNIDEELNILASKMMIIDDRIYILHSDKLMEIKIEKMKNLIFSINNSWNILSGSSSLFKNCLYSNMLGKAYFYIPSKEKTCNILHLESLDGYKILDAAYEKDTMIVVAFKKGSYSRFTIKFLSNDFTFTDIVEEKDVTLSEINFTTLDNKVSLLLADDEIQITVAKSTNKKILSSVGLPLDCVLENDGNSVYYYCDRKLFRIKMN